MSTGVPEAPDAPARAGRPIVLVIEDEPDLRTLLGVALSQFDVILARDGEAGIALARSRAPDAIVTDVVMPKFSGEDLIAVLKAAPETRGIPVLILTAKADVDFRARMLRSGADDFIPKPFSPVELVARVSNAVSRKRTRDVLRSALHNKDADIERLARDLAEKRRGLESALEQMSFARDQALRASALKSNFLNMVSHELRTPLTAMRLLVDSLVRISPTLPPKGAELASRLHAATDRTLRLIDSLLHYAQVERDRLTLDLFPFSPAEVASEVALEHRAAAAHKQLSLSVDVGEAPPAFVSDPKLVRVVLSNLVGNAVRFTEAGSVIVKATSGPTTGALRFEVTDTGAGIDSADHARIFEPFFQVEAIRHKHAPGFGLGLALVHDIVRALGGDIEVTSARGAGSTFAVTFPAL